MIWLIISIVIIALICWLLISPLILEVDTRLPEAKLRWATIGGARIWFDGEWLLSFSILFYHRTIRLQASGMRKKQPVTSKKSGAKRRPAHLFSKIWRVLKTFRIREWRLAIDTGDAVLNGQLYPLNFARFAMHHLFINFQGENFLLVKITNRPWKIVYAFIR